VPTKIRHYYSGNFPNAVTVIEKGYENTRSTMHLVTTDYDVSSGQPVWVGRSDSFEPSSFAALAGALPGL